MQTLRSSTIIYLACALLTLPCIHAQRQGGRGRRPPMGGGLPVMPPPSNGGNGGRGISPLGIAGGFLLGAGIVGLLGRGATEPRPFIPPPPPIPLIPLAPFYGPPPFRNPPFGLSGFGPFPFPF